MGWDDGLAFEPLPDTTPVPLEDNTGCRWPVNVTLEGNERVMFCNMPVTPGKVHKWCDQHHAIGVKKIVRKAKVVDQ